MTQTRIWSACAPREIRSYDSLVDTTVWIKPHTQILLETRSMTTLTMRANGHLLSHMYIQYLASKYISPRLTTQQTFDVTRTAVYYVFIANCDVTGRGTSEKDPHEVTTVAHCGDRLHASLRGRDVDVKESIWLFRRWVFGNSICTILTKTRSSFMNVWIPMCVYSLTLDVLDHGWALLCASARVYFFLREIPQKHHNVPDYHRCRTNPLFLCWIISTASSSPCAQEIGHWYFVHRTTHLG